MNELSLEKSMLKDNKKRYYEIDLARGLVILVLVFIHVFEFWGDEYGYANILTPNAMDFLRYPSNIVCIFGAPVFMLCMGINLSFTRHNLPKDFFVRGISLLLLEAVFNLVRYSLPGIIGILISGKGFSNQSEILQTMLYAQFNSDILAFAGLTFLLIALFKKLGLNEKGILIVAVIMTAISEVLIRFVSPVLDENLNPTINNILGNFIWINGDSTFPLIQWFLIPVVGMLWGKALLKVKKENLFMLKTMFGFTIVFAIICVILALLGENVYIRINDVLNNNCMDVVCVLAELSLSFIFITLIYFVYHMLRIEKNKTINKYIKTFSADITYYYCIQWIIIGFVMFITMGLEVRNCQKLDTLPTVLIILAIMVISAVLGHYIHELVKKRKK